MANKTDPTAIAVHGRNPQHLIEKIIRNRIYENLYYKERCFALTTETLVDEAVNLTSFGGSYGGNNQPTPFLCLILRMLQIQPDKEIVIEFIKNEDYRYVRLLGAFYLRLVGTAVEVYKYLEPLYYDYRRVRRTLGSGGTEVTHVDEFVDELLHDEVACNVTLPYLAKRWVLEDNDMLEPRVSILEQLEQVEPAREAAEEEEPAPKRRKREKWRERRRSRSRSRSRERRRGSRDERRRGSRDERRRRYDDRDERRDGRGRHKRSYGSDERRFDGDGRGGRRYDGRDDSYGRDRDRRDGHSEYRGDDRGERERYGREHDRRGSREYGRRDRDREYERRDRERSYGDRRCADRRSPSRRSPRRADRGSPSRRERPREQGASKSGDNEISLEETNRIRASLGLAPLS